MNRQNGVVKKVYTRVEDRSDYVEPENTDELLDRLENTGSLDGVLSPKFINDRLVYHYKRFHEGSLTREEKKDIINKAWNLSRPTLHQVIRKFRKTIDVYPNIRGDIMGNCSIVVSRAFREQRYDLTRNTRMTSYFYEFFIYAVLGSLSKFFKEKKKYISVDPTIMGKICSGDMCTDGINSHLNQPYDQENPY
jgi:hypothetical protein